MDEVFYIPTVVPVFPLPQLVLFPGTLLPLHVFEPRYRALTRDAWAGDRAVALAHLRAGYEPLYHTHRAPIHPVLTVARLEQAVRLPEGRYNILVRGLSRARVVDESEDKAYRLARIELLETGCRADPDRVAELRAELAAAAHENPGLDPSLRGHWDKLLATDLDLDPLTDLLAAALPADADVRQLLLEETDAAERAELLVRHLRTLAALAARRRFSGIDGERNLN